MTGRVGWKGVLRWGERLLIVGLLGFVVWKLAPQLAAWTGFGAGDRPAPETTVRTLDGRVFGPEEMAGRVVVVNFWATWCPPCRLEMPALQELHRDHAGEGLLVLGLSVDRGGRGTVRRFLERRGLDFPVAMARPRHRRAFGGVRQVPVTVLIDRGGRIRHRVEGLFAPPAMKAAVRRLLAEPLPPGDGPTSDRRSGRASSGSLGRQRSSGTREAGSLRRAQLLSSGSSSPSGTKSSASPLLQ